MYSKSIPLKSLSLIIALVMLMMTVLGGLNASHATLTAVPAPVQTSSVSSSKYFTDEYYKVSTPLDQKNVIYVEGRTKIPTKRFCIRVRKDGTSTYYITAFVTPNKNGEFSIKINTKKGNTAVPTVIGGKGTVAKASECFDTRPGYRAVADMTPGTYHLTIARATTTKDASLASGWYKGSLGNGKDYAYKDVILTVKSGNNNNPKVVKYSKAMTNNINVRGLYEKKSYHDSSYKGSYVRYQDTYLADLNHLVLKNPATGKLETMTSSKVSYLKKVADSVTSGASTNYKKLVKIYEYVGSNFYYDALAYQKSKNQYANPYTNLYNLRNKKASKNSTKTGKVATTCQGYAAMVVALARCKGIPARIVNGHHISAPLEIWAGESASSVKKRDHWWAEAWVNGRWVIIDACSATTSKWSRSSFSSTGTWTKANHISYAYFDPSTEQLANSYSYNEVYPGSTAGKYINRANEVKQLKAFLNTKSSGKSNGKRLNSKYVSTNFSTWGTTAPDDFLTNGYGRVTHILWGNKSLAGTMNLTDFSKLKYLTVYNNKITQLNLKGCSSLEKISATYTKITTFDSSASSKTTSITTKGNKLTTAKFKNGTKTITITRNIKGGTFAFDYTKSKSKPLTIYASDPAKGYKYLGIYSSSGKKLSSSKTYSFKPTGTKYIVKYAKK